MRHRPKRSARVLKLQHAIAALVPAAIVTLSITGFMWAQKEVTVVVDGRSLCVATQANDVAAVLEQAGVPVDSHDVVTPSPDAEVESGTTIVVRHSVPVTLSAGGHSTRVDVVGDTVADALVAVGMADAASSATVTPALNSPLTPGMDIAVPDTFTRFTQEQTALAPEVEVHRDPTLPRGERRVITTGAPGRLLRVYRVAVIGGVEGEPGLSAEKVVSKAQPQIVAIGTGAVVTRAVNRRRVAQLPPSTGKKLRVATTAYSPRQAGLDFTTATGARAEYGVIAVDPRVIPLGTKVFVPGYGYAVARDTGGAIKGKRVDLCFDSVAEAMSWGRRTVTIVVLD